MKHIIIVILIFAAFPSFSQKVKAKKPNKHDTELWINEKIRTYGYSEGNTSNQYSIEFNGSVVEVTDILKSEFGDVNSLTLFDIKDIDYIYFTEYYKIFVFHIKLKKGSYMQQYFDGEKQELRDELGFELNMSFKDNNLPERMKKAFSRLIELNGGKSIIVKDIY